MRSLPSLGLTFLSAAVLTAASLSAHIVAGGTDAKAAFGGLDWRPCTEVAEDWNPQDHRSECATLQVPLDYSQPESRRIGIAASRIRASIGGSLLLVKDDVHSGLRNVPCGQKMIDFLCAGRTVDGTCEGVQAAGAN
ncbi:hypothetical protein C6Y14_12325 [Streptomyces dioscori]|uniref:Uncharacterized protein n=1 Tax=Streptomyces dioscori TaxID=2109333 RepID=A0A2P8Q9N5_9ACTN|nr:hypothetical protein [Streptomyces dioscori]PSM42962.1 hypothetical protein C6Y14_12325 [Streptomyces dioscori]